MFKFSVSNFKKASFWTIIIVYFVIIAGGVVRCTGSGMGCPDWPKCFGRWIPPTEISELPTNYVELYSKGGHLSVEFNVLKTWTEYINRLIGVLVGFAIFFTFLYSLTFWKSNRKIVWYSLAAFLLVGFQGWLGSKVVSTNLLPFMVSIHMFVALVIVGILIYAYSLVDSKLISYKSDKYIKWMVFFAMIFSLIQIILGTQVRQAVDVVAKSLNYSLRDTWEENLGSIFVVHRLFAYLIVTINAYLIYKFNTYKAYFERNMFSIMILVEILSGFILTYLGFPSFIQPVHLVCATLIFGYQFYVFSSVMTNKNE